MHNKCSIILDESVEINKILYDYGDTVIYNGLYNKKPCIIKKILLLESGDFPIKFIREVSFLKNSNNKNIINLYDVKTDENSVYLVLEKGEISLSQTNIDDPMHIFEDIINGLKYMHSLDYIHGDLKPDNIVLSNIDNKTTTKLIDFGSTIKSYRKSAIAMPTYNIAPMEILCGSIELIPEKIDSWSLGCISYFLATGNELFFGNDEKIIIDQIKEKFSPDYTKNIRKVLRETETHYILKKAITEFINLNKHKRASIKEYSFGTKINKVNKNIKSKQYTNCNNFRKYDDYDKTRNKILEVLLVYNICNNISIENIFMTFKLVTLLQFSNNVNHIKYCVILYGIVTKLVSNISFTIDNLLTIINNIDNEIQTTKNEIKLKMINISKKLNWNFDIDTLISYVHIIPEKIKLQYLMISISLLRDPQYDYMDTSYLFEAIMTIIDKDKLCKLHITKQFCKNINMALVEMENDNSSLGTVIRKYLECIEIGSV